MSRAQAIRVRLRVKAKHFSYLSSRKIIRRNVYIINGIKIYMLLGDKHQKSDKLITLYINKSFSQVYKLLK